MQNLIGVCVANTAEDARISQSPFERTVLGNKRCPKCVKIACKDVNAAGINGTQALFVTENMQGGASLCTSFCKNKRAVGKVKCRETIAARQLSSRWAPVQSTGNHQMKYQPEIVIKPHGNAFADSPQFTHGMTFYIRDWWLR